MSKFYILYKRKKPTKIVSSHSFFFWRFQSFQPKTPLKKKIVWVKKLTSNFFLWKKFDNHTCNKILEKIGKKNLLFFHHFLLMFYYGNFFIPFLFVFHSNKFSQKEIFIQKEKYFFIDLYYH